MATPGAVTSVQVGERQGRRPTDQVLQVHGHGRRFLMQLGQQAGARDTVLAAGIAGGDDVLAHHIHHPVPRIRRGRPDLGQPGRCRRRHGSRRGDRAVHIDVVTGLDDVAGELEQGLPRPARLAADPGHAIVTVRGFDRILGGHRVVAADAHLQFPVIALGERDQIGIGILALGDLGLHLLAGLGGQLHGLLGLAAGRSETGRRDRDWRVAGSAPAVRRWPTAAAAVIAFIMLSAPDLMLFRVLVTASTGSNLPQL